MKVTRVVFVNAPVQVEFRDARDWEVIVPFAACLLVDGYQNPIRVTAPKGFVTDLASIPRAIWNIFPPFGGYTEAAILHDWLYRSGGEVEYARTMLDAPGNSTGATIYTKTWLDRETSDNVFLAAMDVLGVGRITRYTLWSAVRAFGGSSYKLSARSTGAKGPNQNA